MAKPTQRRSIYLTDLYVENVKPFKANHHLDLRDASGGPARWTLILGDNGVGKTTLLQCLALMTPVLNPKEDDDGALINYLEPAGSENVKFLEGYARSGDLHVSLNAQMAANVALGRAPLSSATQVRTSIGFDRTGGETADFVASEEQSNITDLPLLIAYGAGRHMASGNFDPAVTPDPTRSLFEGAAELFDVEEMLQHLEYAALKSKSAAAKRRYRVLLKMIADLLPDVESAESIKILAPEETGLGRFTVQVRTPYGDVSIRELSYGYQTVVAWLCDLAWRMFQRYQTSQNPLLEPAIVLVDEIDLHLHPVWQRRLRDRLIEHFPAVQFIATAHSPLMAQASMGSNLAVVAREADSAIIHNDPPSVMTWRLGQVITSELFGLPTEWSVEIEAAFDEQRALSAKESRTPSEVRRLKELQELLRTLPTEKPADERAMSIIRRAAAALGDT